MADYVIYSTSGTPYEIKEGKADPNQCPIIFVGHGMPDYGEEQNQNFLRLLENYCYTDEPENPLIGQFWCRKVEDNDNSYYEMRICKNKNGATLDDRWDKLPRFATTSGGTEPSNPQDGDLWYDFNVHSLKVRDGNKWVIIGPQDAEHLDHMYEAKTIKNVSPTARYNIPKTVFARDIYNVGDTYPSNPQGSLNLVEIKVLIKEIDDTVGSYTEGKRAYACKLSTVIQADKHGTEASYGYDIVMVGAPIYEVLAKSEDFDFNVIMYLNDNTSDLTVEVSPETSGTLSTTTHCVIGFDTDITRV